MRCALFSFVLLIVSACSMLEPAKPSYVVFFRERSVQLDEAARTIVAAAAERAKANPAASVDVAGYTDSKGSPEADVLLSQRRAQIVADTLIADGVSADRLVRTGQGQTGNDPGVASRRVEITVGGS